MSSCLTVLVVVYDTSHGMMGEGYHRHQQTQASLDGFRGGRKGRKEKERETGGEEGEKEKGKGKDAETAELCPFQPLNPGYATDVRVWRRQTGCKLCYRRCQFM